MLKSKKILLLTGIFRLIFGVLTINAQDSGEPVSSSTNTTFFLDKKDSTTKTQTAGADKRRFEAGVHQENLARTLQS